MTSEERWDPSTLDCESDFTDQAFLDAAEGTSTDWAPDPRFNRTGQYNFRDAHISIFDESPAAEVHFAALMHEHFAYQNEQVPEGADDFHDCHTIEKPAAIMTTTEAPDFEALRPMFGWFSAKAIKTTFQNTTQFAKSVVLGTGTFRRHFKTRFPAANTPRRDEAVCSDYVPVGIPAVDDGSTGAQIFSGVKTRFLSSYGVKSDKEFVGTLEDEIRKRGAMEMLVTVSLASETSKRVVDILRGYKIDDWQSEADHQHQNPAERQVQRCKEGVNRIMDRTGAPAHCWLLCLQYVIFLLKNSMALASLGNLPPITALTLMTWDVSVLMNFHFYEPVYLRQTNSDKINFADDSKERFGYWVGIAENVGDVFRYKVLDAATEKVICRSDVRSANTNDPNRRAILEAGEEESNEVPQILKARRGRLDDDSKTTHLPIIDPVDLRGRTFLMEPDADSGERFRGTVKRLISLHGDEEPEHIDGLEFIVEVSGSEQDQILTYAEILDYIERQKEVDTDLSHPDAVFRYTEILDHQGPLTPSDPNYKGSLYNVKPQWCTGEVTWEPLSVMAADDPVTCAIYAQKNGLLNTKGWKHLRRIAKREKVFKRLINHTKLKQFLRAPKYKFGVRIPYDMKLDAENGNHLWSDATKLEVELLDSFNVFKDKGRANLKGKRCTNGPNGHQQIRARFVYDCKHDWRHRARFVAGGHLTDVPSESTYSGVVSMKDIRLIVFLAELNQLELWGADISSAYLLAETKEKVFIIADGAFGEREGHILVIFKEQYGIRTSGVRWHNKLFEVMVDLGFTPSKVPDIYMQRNRKKDGTEVWEYIATYVDDLAIAMVNPQELIDKLEGEPYKFKCKGVGPLEYHLGCNFERDPDGTLRWVPRKYIDRVLDTYKRLFEEEPKMSKRFCSTPLEKGDHPELDTTELLDTKGIKQYQSLVGCLQWLITLGRYDIHTATMTMSRFSSAPRKGHLERLKRMVNYIRHTREYGVRVRTAQPDYSDVPDNDYDWQHSVYTGAQEMLPHDMPTPLGKSVTTTHYVDANLEHCQLTGRAVTGILHLVNGTPIDWYSKRQSTVETATYGSEIVAARLACDGIIDLRTTLRYLGVPIKGTAYLFGDNRAVDCALPHSKVTKCHHALNWHRIRECIAAKLLNFIHIEGSKNPGDILSKHYGYSDTAPMIQALFNWKGDTYFCKNPKRIDFGTLGSDKTVTNTVVDQESRLDTNVTQTHDMRARADPTLKESSSTMAKESKTPTSMENPQLRWEI